MDPLDASVTQGQSTQFTIHVFDSAAGGSVDLLIYSPLNSPYKSDDISRVSVQSPKGNVALSFSPDDSTLLIGKVDTFSEDGSQIDIPITITIASGAPIGEYDVSASSVLPNGGVNGFVNAGLTVTGTTTPPENPTPPPTPPLTTPSGAPKIFGTKITTNYDKTKDYQIGDKITIESVTATNHGDGKGTRTIDFTVTYSNDDKSKIEKLFSDTFTLDVGQSDEHMWSVPYVFKESGTYEFRWDGQTLQVSVKSDSEDPHDQPTTTAGKANIYGYQMDIKEAPRTKFVTGDEITITSVFAKNDGDEIGIAVIPLTITSSSGYFKNVVLSEAFEIPSHSSKQRKLDYRLDFPYPGNYTVEWGQVRSTFEVIGEPNPHHLPIEAFNSKKPNIVGYIHLLYNIKYSQGLPLNPGDVLDIQVKGCNNGDGLGSKTIPFNVIRISDGKTSTETLFTKTFGPYPGECTFWPYDYGTGGWHYTLKEPGRYLFMFDGSSSSITVYDKTENDDPRDAKLHGNSNTYEWFLDWRSNVHSGSYTEGDTIQFDAHVQNVGDATVTKKLDFKVKNLQSDGPTKTLYTKTFTLKPDQIGTNDKPIRFVPEDAGIYYFEWGDAFQAIVVKEIPDDPRDGPPESILEDVGVDAPNIIGRVNAELRSSGFIKVVLDTKNLGTETGTKTLHLKVTEHTNDKHGAKTIRSETLTLKPGAYSLIEELFLPEEAFLPEDRQYVFEWDDSFDVVKMSDGPHDASTSKKSDIRGVALDAKESTEPVTKERMFTITRYAYNSGDETEVRTIPLTVTQIHDGQIRTETIHTETYDLGPSESVSDQTTYIAKQSGMYLFEWDGEKQMFKIGSTTDELKTNPEKNSGCLIATATYGTELAPQVQLLREARENVLFGTSSGAAFMAGFNQFYYSFSPTISDWERQNPAFKEIVKITITPMLSTLLILNYVDVDSEQEMLGYGIGIILLNLVMYFVAPLIIILKIRSKFNPRPYAQK